MSYHGEAVSMQNSMILTHWMHVLSTTVGLFLPLSFFTPALYTLITSFGCKLYLSKFMNERIALAKAFHCHGNKIIKTSAMIIRPSFIFLFCMICYLHISVTATFPSIMTVVITIYLQHLKFHFEFAKWYARNRISNFMKL